MTELFHKRDLPDHLFNIPDLDFHEDLFVNRLSSPWFRLGSWTLRSQCNDQGVESVIGRQSIMLTPGNFSAIYDKLESIGDVLRNLGTPGGSIRSEGGQKEYSYAPFHQFDLSSVSCEPLVFVRRLNSRYELFINPDFDLFFELEEKTSGCGIWWDPKRGSEVLRRRTIDNDNLQIVEVQTGYLVKYLRERQLSLVVGHYRHLHLFDPSPETIKAFVQEDKDLVQGSPAEGTKAIFQNWGLNRDGLGRPLLQRRLHLWFEIKPTQISVDNPWADEPPFDPYEFILPTRSGPVAPARWKNFQRVEGREFKGISCDFMDRIYFKQEVLSKYEGASGFCVWDDGSVSCRDYWGLVRSTSRLGNELLSTAIGDFAEGLPFEEWPHWRQHAIEPPSPETLKLLREEQSIPETVNSLVEQLNALNASFAEFADVMGVEISTPFWGGSLESLAGRQLKWVYPTVSDDDELLKRATLMSTLVIDGLVPKSLRKLLQNWGKNLHQNDQQESLGSRKLIERVTLIAVMIEEFQPNSAEIPELVKQAESQTISTVDPELQAELKKSFDKIRGVFAPLAFLYDLRTHGGLAHSPNMGEVATAMIELGLPERNWHRLDYLRLLHLVVGSIRQISAHLVTAAESASRR